MAQAQPTPSLHDIARRMFPRKSVELRACFDTLWDYASLHPSYQISGYGSPQFLSRTRWLEEFLYENPTQQNTFAMSRSILNHGTAAQRRIFVKSLHKLNHGIVFDWVNNFLAAAFMPDDYMTNNSTANSLERYRRLYIDLLTFRRVAKNGSHLDTPMTDGQLRRMLAFTSTQNDGGISIARLLSEFWDIKSSRPDIAPWRNLRATHDWRIFNKNLHDFVDIVHHVAQVPVPETMALNETKYLYLMIEDTIMPMVMDPQNRFRVPGDQQLQVYGALAHELDWIPTGPNQEARIAKYFVDYLERLIAEIFRRKHIVPQPKGMMPQAWKCCCHLTFEYRPGQPRFPCRLLDPCGGAVYQFISQQPAEERSGWWARLKALYQSLAAVVGQHPPITAPMRYVTDAEIDGCGLEEGYLKLLKVLKPEVRDGRMDAVDWDWEIQRYTGCWL